MSRLFRSCYSRAKPAEVTTFPAATLGTVAQQSAHSPGNTTTPSASAPAGLTTRFGALLVDWILCVLAAGLFSHPARDAWAPPVVLILEYAFFIGLFGQTPGMWLARVRCVSVTTGGPIGVARAALRGLLLCLLVPALIMDARRRGLHDRAAGSIVLAGRPIAA
jgi:uncharacterized RDD family membrane protein YckC